MIDNFKGAGASEAPSQTKEWVVCKWYFQTSKSVPKRPKSWVPINIHVRILFGHRPSPDGSKMAIIWPFSEFFCLPGHFFGCWDHIYAYNWGKLNQKTCHIYGVVVTNHSGHGQPPVRRRGGVKI